MPRTPEPAIVTVSKMTEHLTARVVVTEQALADATAEVATAAFEAERGDADALRRLAASEKRRDKLTAELERLRMAAGELDRQLAAERAATEAARQRALLAKYVIHRDAHQEAHRAMLSAVEAMQPLMATAREHGQAAAKIALQLGLPDERNSGALALRFGYIQQALTNVIHNEPHRLADIHATLSRDWREGGRVGGPGKRVAELQAALGEGTTAKQ